MAASDPDPGRDPLLRVLRGLIRPLVKTLISRGVTAPAFYRLLKKVYVEVAYDEFRIDETAPTDSRISLLTGVHRRDVRDILSDEDKTWETARRKTATFATVFGRWLATPEYQNEDGSPRTLARSGDEGRDFESLVRAVNRDIRPRTVLDELLRQGLVEETADGLLNIAKDAVIGPASEDHKMVFFASNVGDHLAAASENLLSETPPFLERAVFYNRLTGSSVDQIEQKARDLSQSVLEELNRDSKDLQDADRRTTDNTQRYRFGVYFYREGDTTDDSDETEGS
ncbi:DUF6502 family protein [Litoreibacter roseus]|uniref:Uncharacterized protein n=1 Tax=Litoreibacter roseus TaxID=2601869 RepID=A0A6N6JI19_9RHOB|nr:DUF6502 family protein [Litoreibacter roseus]GFE65991.1 hypothetical protein KIN_30650 [Litoreibacter roseus]